MKIEGAVAMSDTANLGHAREAGPDLHKRSAEGR